MIHKFQLYSIFLIICLISLSFRPLAIAQRYDPLGNKVFEKSGKELYKIYAKYGLLEGESSLRRDKEFGKKTGNRNFFMFDIQGKNISHQLTVGNFWNRFSDFSLNKEMFDAARWNITVPKARGRISTFLARVTNNTFYIEGEHSKIIEDETITSNADWFMVGARAEANLGAWYVKFATLPEFVLPLPKIGVNYVNRFFTNYDLTRTTNPFSGVTINNPPSTIYLSFSDGSPENPDGARVYHTKVYLNGKLEYYFEGGKEPAGVLMMPNSSKLGVDCRYVDKDGTFTYRFILLTPQNIKSIKFELDIANDYVVELSTNGEDYRIELNAEANVTDESNRGWRSFYYGEMTDETIYGFDLHTTLLGTSIEAERAWYTQTLQHPILGGERSHRTAGAWYIDLNRSFGPVTLRSEYTKIDPFYTAANFIDDNDDENPHADSREPEILIAGNSPNDLDGDGIKDWEDDFLLFQADSPKFRLGLRRESMDFNNNGQPDNLEDDSKPNYREDYEEGSKGHHTYMRVELPFVEGLSLIPGYYEKMLISEKKSARGWYNVLAYTPRAIPNFGTVMFRYTIRRAHDIIPDDVIVHGEKVKDELALQNYLGNIFTMIADYKNVENLTLRSKFKYQYDALFHSDERVIDTALISQIRYEYKPREDLIIAPAFRSDRTIGYTIPFDKHTAVNVTRNAYILTLTHQVAEQLQLSAGLQFSTWRNLNDPGENFNRSVGFLEIVIQGKAFSGQRIGMLISGNYIAQEYLQHIGGGTRSTNISISLFLL